jgi:hypothetical protein
MTDKTDRGMLKRTFPMMIWRTLVTENAQGGTR